jgi:hypothetical protein
VGDWGGVTAAIGLGAQLVKKRTDSVHDLNVGLFVPAADVVGFAKTPSFQHTLDGAGVVFDVEPVATCRPPPYTGSGLPARALMIMR